MFKTFSHSQDKWECDVNLNYPPFKLNGLRTTGPRGENMRFRPQFSFDSYLLNLSSNFTKMVTFES